MSRARALTEKPRSARISWPSRSRRSSELAHAQALRVSRPDDRCEAEADRTADAVVRAEPYRKQVFSISSLPVWNGPAPGVSRSASRSGDAGVAPAATPALVDSPGERLAPAIRTAMETRFGADFRDVRIHRDAGAAQAARALDAEAWTVGRDVAFGAGRYRPETPQGVRLLAHELAHVIQQRSTPVGAAPLVQRKGGTFGGFFANIGRSIASIFGDEPGFSDTTLQKYLAVLDAGDIEDDYDSDDKARIVVRRWKAGASGFRLSKERKVLLIREMMSGFTGDADEEAILDLLAGSPDPELTHIFGAIRPEVLRDEIHGEERVQFDRIVARWTDRTGAMPARDLLSKTHAVTETEHAFVESTLTPGSKLVPAPPPPPPPPPPAADAKAEKPAPPPPAADAKAEKPAPPPPPPVVVPPPVMTGLPPAPGVAGPFETSMTTAMKSYVATRGAAFRALKAAGPRTFPVERANSVALAAQQQSEAYFAPWIRVASRVPAGTYHPGSYDLTTMLGDQSTVPITDFGISAAPGVTPHPGRAGWMSYWMVQDDSGGKAVMDKYNCVPSSRATDQTEFERVKNKVATDPANRPDIDDTIHGWPAEATGGVYIQTYQAPSRVNRWDVFTTLIHEMMHVLQHPNYERTHRLIGGDAQEILKEGMADVMRHDLWDGPGQLAARISTPAYAPLRRQVEGADLSYDASAVAYHPDYPNKYPKAKEIVEGGSGYPGVGIENARAAFFLGRTELLGLGAGTSTKGGASLAGVAEWTTTESAEADVVVAGPTETETTLRNRTGAPAGGVRAMDGKPVAAGAAIAVGTKVRVPGVRTVPAIAEDTLGSLASQNGVTTAALAGANNLPPATLPGHKFPAGTRVLIPRRGP